MPVWWDIPPHCVVGCLKLTHDCPTPKLFQFDPCFAMDENEILNIFRKKYGKVKKGAKGWIRITCPTCTPKNSGKLKRYVNLVKLTSHCFICETKIKKEELLDLNVISNYKPSLKLQMTDTGSTQEQHPWAKKMPGYKFISINQLVPGHPALQFLSKDHLHDLDYYSECGVVYCPVDAGITMRNQPFTTTAERIIFPVIHNGVLEGWQGRSLPGTFYGDMQDTLRYYHVHTKGNYLFNYDQAKKYRTVIVTEGAKKALKFKNGVATFGKGVSPRQVQLLQEWDNVILLLDAEDDAQKTSIAICAAVNTGPRKAINIDLREFGYTSPDEAATEELQQIAYFCWTRKYGNT